MKELNNLIMKVMKKKVFNWMLMTAMVCGLSLSLTACSDDDENENGGSNTANNTEMPAGVSDDATLLGSLLSQWVEEFDASGVDASILNRTYEATVGTAADASQPFVRTVVVGTEEAADNYAKTVLGSLGINPQQPVGFRWQNAAIGTISYERGTGNELGVIEVSVKQLPNLTKILLVESQGDNVAQQPYYQKGDIVEYIGSDAALKGKLFICIQDHSYGSEASWISFDSGKDYEKLKTSDCSWMTVGKDYYFKGSNAKAQSLLTWLKEFVISDLGYQSTVQHLSGCSSKNMNQVVPSTQELRAKFLNGLIRTPQNVVLDLNKTINGEQELRADKTGMKRVDQAAKSKYQIRTYYPAGLLMPEETRWAMGWSYDYWQPYMVMVTAANAGQFEQLLQSVPSQYSDKSHFEWSNYDKNIQYSNDFYQLYVVSMHWTHEGFKPANLELDNLVDFTKHQNVLNNIAIDETNVAHLDWTLHNITSHELVVKDKGEEYSKFKTIYRAKENSATSRVQVGSLIGSDGKFYWSKEAALAANATPVAMVVTLNSATPVEEGTDYNSLAIALEDVDTGVKFVWGDENSRTQGCTGSAVASNQYDQLDKVLNGIAITRRLATHACNASHTHYFAETVFNKPKPINMANFSSWFVPSVGQALQACYALGYTKPTTSLNLGGSYNSLWNTTGYPNADITTVHMTCTETTSTSGSYYGFIKGALSPMPFTMQSPVRPMIAFRYVQQ